MLPSRRCSGCVSPQLPSNCQGCGGSEQGGEGSCSRTALLYRPRIFSLVQRGAHSTHGNRSLDVWQSERYQPGSAQTWAADVLTETCAQLPATAKGGEIKTVGEREAREV